MLIVVNSCELHGYVYGSSISYCTVMDLYLADCGSLNNPANGRVSFTETFGGSVANYSCDQGYMLCGAENRICQSNGTWSGSPPECISTSNAYSIL